MERCVSAARDALYSGRKKVIPHMMTLLAALTFAQDGCRAAGLEQDVLFCELFPALLGGANRRLQRPFRASDALVSAVALLLRNLAFSRVHLPLFVEKKLSMDVHARGGALGCTERIGVGAEGIQKIRRHPFFKGFSWTAVLEQRVEMVRPKVTPDPDQGPEDVKEAVDIPCLVEPCHLNPNEQELFAAF